MSKTLNTNAITNELENSSFFQPRPADTAIKRAEREIMPRTSVAESPVSATVPEQQAVLAKAIAPKSGKKPTAAAQAARTSSTTTRPYVRRTFDFFEDQIAYLTKASLEERLAGGEGSMNSMVREALDAFIEKRRRKS